MRKNDLKVAETQTYSIVINGSNPLFPVSTQKTIQNTSFSTLNQKEESSKKKWSSDLGLYLYETLYPLRFHKYSATPAITTTTTPAPTYSHGNSSAVVTVTVPPNFVLSSV